MRADVLLLALLHQRVLPSLLSAFWLDARLFLIVEAIVLALGLLIALVRTMRAPVLFPLRLVAAVFVDVMRGVPLLILLYLVGFGVPALGFSFLPTDYTVLGGAALALCYSAYVSEVFRAGIDSVHPSQPAAALALGLTRSAGAAPRRAPAGGPPRRAAAAQRLHRADEGRGAGVDARAAGDRAGRADRRATQTSTTRRTSRRRVIYLCVTLPLIRDRRPPAASARLRRAERLVLM